MGSTANNPLRRADVWALVVILFVSAAAAVWLVPRNHSSATATHTGTGHSTPASSAVTPSSSSGTKRPDPNTVILARLRPFLSGFFTIAAHETAAARAIRVKHLAPASALTGVNITLPGIPAGSVMTPQLSQDDNVQFQAPKGQKYVIYQVTVQLKSGHTTRQLFYLTDSVWVLTKGQWTMAHFAYNPNGVYLP